MLDQGAEITDPDRAHREQHRGDLHHVDPERVTRTVLQACQTLLANQVRLTTQLREHGCLSDGTATAVVRPVLPLFVFTVSLDCGMLALRSQG